MSVPPIRCDTCKWWRAVDAVPVTFRFGEYRTLHLDRGGECHVNPPAASPRYAGERAPFPITQASDWCGQHAAAGGGAP